jgi:hypothetical protein
MADTTKPDGQFDTYDAWQKDAMARMGGMNALCVDAAGRKCLTFDDMTRALFPVRFWFGEGGQTPSEQAAEKRLAKIVRDGLWPGVLF